MLSKRLNKLEGKPVPNRSRYSERKLAQNKPARSASAPVVVKPALPATPGSAGRVPTGFGADGAAAKNFP